jgi:hypothetical protein
VKFVLEFGLRALGSGADGFGVVAVECARGLGVVAVITISFFLVDSTVGVEVCLSRRGKCCVCVCVCVRHTDSARPHHIPQSKAPHQTALT